MKRRALRIIGIIVLVILVAIGGLLAYVKTALPNVAEAPDIEIKATPDMIARGRYLANHVMLCVDCHSTRDWNQFAGPLVPGTEGQGGEVFDQKFGFPGKYIAKNITPYGLKNWTDGEIFRAITTGVSRDGTPLFPIMPHPNFGKADSTDILAVIAYLRTFAPIENNVEASKSDFPMNFIINTIPKDPAFTTRPSPEDKLAYGAYMLNAALCGECHTKFEKGEMVGEPLAGGREFPLPDGSVLRSANLTPHATGLGSWTEEMFVQKFKMYADSSYKSRTPAEVGYQTIMPWTMYAQMTEEDLSAIYAYLKTVPAVENKVEKFTSAQ